MFLKIRALTKRYGGRAAVEDVNLDVERGEFVALLGPSGCGKTTILGLVGGHIAPDAGSVEIDGQDVTAMPAHIRPTATVFQNYALFPHMNVAENVAYGLRCQGQNKKQRLDAAMNLLDLTGLSGRGHERIDCLSGGEQQRVALARALALNPKVLLLDEPLSSLDAKLRRRMRREIREIQARIGITAILVTHDQEEAMDMAGRLAVMEQGRIVQTGTPKELYLRPRNAFVAGFIGRVTTLRDSSGRLFGVRPENIHFTQTPGAWPCRIVERRFNGAVTSYEAVLADGTMAFVERPAGEAELEPGRLTHLAFAPQAAIALDRPETPI